MHSRTKTRTSQSKYLTTDDTGSGLARPGNLSSLTSRTLCRVQRLGAFAALVLGTGCVDRVVGGAGCIVEYAASSGSERIPQPGPNRYLRIGREPEQYDNCAGCREMSRRTTGATQKPCGPTVSGCGALAARLSLDPLPPGCNTGL